MKTEDKLTITHEQASAFALELKTLCNKHRIMLSAEDIRLIECPADEQVVVDLELTPPTRGLDDDLQWEIYTWVGDNDTGLSPECTPTDIKK